MFGTMTVLESGLTWLVKLPVKVRRSIWAGSSAFVCKRARSFLMEMRERSISTAWFFGGNNILDQTWEQAVFQSLGSSPATMRAGKFLDYYSCINGNSGEQADAEQAYIQAELK